VLRCISSSSGGPGRQAGRQYHNHHRCSCMQWLPAGRGRLPVPGLDQRALYLGSAKPYAGRDQIQIDQTIYMSITHHSTTPMHHRQLRHVRFRDEMMLAAVSVLA
jgi:hypothetical protein